ncbi:MAG: glycosyltransferase family 4 protein [Anaerolineaceae bacterium]
MKIVLVADGRSMITQSWLVCLIGKDVEISLVSTFPCEKPQGIHKLLVLPVAFSAMAGGQVKLGGQKQKRSWMRKMLSSLRGLLQNLRYQTGPLTLPFYKKRYLDFLEAEQPDIVHALRIPFEGMLSSYTPKKYPLVISTWGNDLTLHAHGSKRMAKWTRKTLQRADGLMADATRDLELAVEWGFKRHLSTMMVPGNGGLPLEYFKKMNASVNCEELCFNPQKFQIINPRGFRPGSVHQDVFFSAIPGILKEIPEIQFLCPAMGGQTKAERWVHELGIEKHVLLLPYLPQPELWYLYQNSDIYLSLSSHDGTPNTFLEAIACGCFPIVGDILSLREWVEDGKNGMLVDPMNLEQVVRAVVYALGNKKLREEAKLQNWKILSEKADRRKIRTKITNFYSNLISQPERS